MEVVFNKIEKLPVGINDLLKGITTP